MAKLRHILARCLAAGYALARRGIRSLTPVWLTVPPGWRLLLDSVVNGGFSVSSQEGTPPCWIRTSVTLLGDVTVATGDHVSDQLLDQHNRAVAVAMDRLASVRDLLAGIQRGRAWLTHGLSLIAAGSLAWTGVAGQTATGLAPGWLATLSVSLPAGWMDSLLAASSAAAGYGGVWGGRWACRTGLRRWIRARIQRSVGGGVTPPPT